jgi:hypothetical protein
VTVTVDGLHVPMWNGTKKPLAIPLSEAWRELRGRDDGDNVTYVHYKSNGDCHYESHPYNAYILIKNYKKERSQLKCLHAAWFQPYDILQKANSGVVKWLDC